MLGRYIPTFPALCVHRLVLLPLRDRLSDLGHLKGWTSQYSVSLSDLVRLQGVGRSRSQEM